MMTSDSVSHRTLRTAIPFPLRSRMRIGGVVVVRQTRVGPYRKDCAYLVRCWHCGAESEMDYNVLVAREGNGTTTCAACKAIAVARKRVHAQIEAENARVCFSSTGPASLELVSRMIERVFPWRAGVSR